MLLPGSVIGLPVQALGAITERVLLFAEQTDLVLKTGYLTRELPRRTGLALGPASLGERTGLGARVSFGTSQVEGRLRHLFHVEYAQTTRRYQRTRVDLFGDPAWVAFRQDWRPQEPFFGIGPESPREGRTSYATRSDLLLLQWARRWYVGEEGGPHTNTRLWVGPRSMVTRVGHERGEPSFETVSPDLGASILDRNIETLGYGASIEHDGRTGAPHWSQGWRALVSLEQHGPQPDAIAFRSQREEGARWTRVDADLETGVSFGRDPRTLRLLLRATDQRVTARPERFLIVISFLGGGEGLHGFEAGRFHDLDRVAGKLS